MMYHVMARVQYMGNKNILYLKLGMARDTTCLTLARLSRKHTLFLFLSSYWAINFTQTHINSGSRLFHCIIGPCLADGLVAIWPPQDANTAKLEKHADRGGFGTRS